MSLSFSTASLSMSSGHAGIQTDYSQQPAWDPGSTINNMQVLLTNSGNITATFRSQPQPCCVIATAGDTCQTDNAITVSSVADNLLAAAAQTALNFQIGDHLPKHHHH